MFFREVIGHKDIKRNLVRTVRDNRISHAQLFSGREGSGNLALALAYAQYASCENRKEDDSCGECPSCVKYGKYIHPDLHFVYPVSTTKDVPKDPVSDDFIFEWRKMLIENPYSTLFQWYERIGMENKQGIITVDESKLIIKKLHLKTFESEYKVMIIWMPEKMNLPAANKLLKIIEEPLGNTLFLLVTENPEQIIPTILSRMQILRIPGINEESIFLALKEKFQLPEEELTTAARLAGGNLVKAFEYVERSEESELNFNRFVRMMRLAYSRDFSGIFEWVEEMAAIGREKQKNFLAFALRMVRENYLMCIGSNDLVRITPHEEEFSKKFSVFIHHQNALIITEELNLACLHIEANGYAKIIFHDLALKLIKLIR